MVGGSCRGSLSATSSTTRTPAGRIRRSRTSCSRPRSSRAALSASRSAISRPCHPCAQARRRGHQLGHGRRTCTAGRLAGLTRRILPRHPAPAGLPREALRRSKSAISPALAIDSRSWLNQTSARRSIRPPRKQIDLRDSFDAGDVVLFRLEADRRPLAAAMVGASIIQDLVALSGERQHGEQHPVS